jgi:integrase
MARFMVDHTMSIKRNLTQKVVEALPIPAQGRTVVWDSKVSGLGVKIEASGHRSFVWYRSVRNYPRWRTLGSTEDLRVDEARGAAAELNSAIAKWKLSGYEGSNPLAKLVAVTLNALVDEYVEKHLKHHAKRPDHAEWHLRWTIEKYMPALRARKISEIRFEDIDALHHKLGARGKHRTANRVVKVVRSLFNFALRARIWKGENPTRGIHYYRENKRKRFLLPDEMPKLWTALRAEKNPDVRDVINLLLWTGARKSDVFAARWQDISLDDNKWTIPDPKSREPYTVPLTPEAVEILRTRWEKRVIDSQWVFPSSSRAGHLIDIANAWRRVLERAGLTYPDGSRVRPTMHDLRRTQGSWQAAQGTPLLTIGKSLGHASIDATQIYSQLILDPVREAMQSSNAAMRAAMRAKPKVLPPVPAAKRAGKVSARTT